MPSARPTSPSPHGLRGRLFVVVFATALISSAPALAQVRVAILAVDLGGDLGPEAADTLTESLAAGLRPTASQVLTPSEVSDQLSEPVGVVTTENTERLVELGEQVEAETMVVAAVDQLEQHYTVRVALILALDGSHLASTTLECSACTWNEALDTVTRAGRGLTTSLPGVLAIDVSPGEALVNVDGTPIDLGEPVILRPGAHRIVASSRGYEDAQQEVQVMPGGLNEVSLSLSRAAESSLRASTMNPAQMWAWITGGAGLLSAVPAILWLALDGRCPIDWEANDGICPEVYNLWPQGLAMMLASTALLSTSIALFVVDSRRRRSSTSVSVIVLPRHDGANVGIAANF